MMALNSMSRVPLEVTARQASAGVESQITICLHNLINHVAFFERTEIMSMRSGDVILPIKYAENYVTGLSLRGGRGSRRCAHVCWVYVWIKFAAVTRQKKQRRSSNAKR